MTTPEPDESAILCADPECGHPLKDHLNGAGPWDYCWDCDCPNFITANECQTCHGKRTVEYPGGHEVACPTCGGSGNA